MLGSGHAAVGRAGTDLEAWRGRDAVVLPGFDAGVDALLPGAGDRDSAEVLDELRLVKDEWEIARLQARLRRHRARLRRRRSRAAPGRRTRRVRGERWLEGTFWRRARLEGNDVGYTSILAGGFHATTLHWWRNHGPIERGQLLLADMGVETDELYTADVTRTLPVDGRYTPEQLRVYRAVYEAQTAGIAEVKVGRRLPRRAPGRDVGAGGPPAFVGHPAGDGRRVVRGRPGTAGGRAAPPLHVARDVAHARHRRPRLRLARREVSTRGTLAAGHVLTVEPGLYFQVNDRTVPPELRGIGVRIEDDIAVTDGEPVNLSASLPRHPAELIAWMAEVQQSPAGP